MRALEDAELDVVSGSTTHINSDSSYTYGFCGDMNRYATYHSGSNAYEGIPCGYEPYYMASGGVSSHYMVAPDGGLQMTPSYAQQAAGIPGSIDWMGVAGDLTGIAGSSISGPVGAALNATSLAIEYYQQVQQ